LRVPPENALLSARAIVLTQVCGVASHGLLRLPHYLRRLRAGGYAAGAELQVVGDRGAVVGYDGQGGLGHWQVWRAAEDAVDRARRHGVAVAAIGNSGHCGAIGIYTLPAVRAGLLSIVLSNGPAVMPAWGGSAPLLSTSPLAFGIAQGDRRVMVDMATTSVARGTIAAYAGRDQPLQAGWALDAQGEPTLDAHAALPECWRRWVAPRVSHTRGGRANNCGRSRWRWSVLSSAWMCTHARWWRARWTTGQAS